MPAAAFSLTCWITLSCAASAPMRSAVSLARAASRLVTFSPMVLSALTMAPSCTAASALLTYFSEVWVSRYSFTLVIRVSSSLSPASRAAFSAASASVRALASLSILVCRFVSAVSRSAVSLARLSFVAKVSFAPSLVYTSAAFALASTAV